MFERKKDELPPFKYNVGDKIMGYHTSIGEQMLVGGEITERKQSTSYLDDNVYNVDLEPELREGGEVGKVLTWWLNEKEAKLFKKDVWDRAAGHWLEHCRLQRKAYIEYVRMHKVLREESDADISDEELEKKLLNQKHWKKSESEILEE